MTGRGGIGVTSVYEWNGENSDKGTPGAALRQFTDTLAVEEPLQIMLAGRNLAVTMRTPGHDLELVTGFLFTEGLIQSEAHLAKLAHATTGPVSQRSNTVRVTLKRKRGSTANPGKKTMAAAPPRYFIAASSCGVCGKASIDSIRRRGIRKLSSGLVISPDLLCQLPERMRAAQTIFAHTGGLHAAALFTATGELLVLREDIGRHNAVDKVIGWALRQSLLPLSQHILLVSGRSGFEIVQKAVAAGIPILASVSAPSSLAVQLAREFNATLVGFLRGPRFVMYAGGERISPSE